MDLWIFILDRVNETLATTIVILAASILLYNVTRNLRNRVARTSAAVLGCVTAAYICDVFISLEPGLAFHAAALRVQWLGIAFVPATLFHLSDALLATTGLPSRGRRRRYVRIRYAISALFLAAALFSDSLIAPVNVATLYTESRLTVSLRAGPLFAVYIAFFLVGVGTAFINVQRARLRCLTRGTRRRMGYLQVAMLTPAVGLFPFSLVLGAGTEFSLAGLILVNLANLGVVFMLLFLAYPLSFFGSNVPDRIVKIELLRFILRGPMTALLALGTFIFTNTTTAILGLEGAEFTPFAIVAIILLWQWGVALMLPHIERRFVYGDEDFDQLAKLQDLSERLLTRSDLLQLLEAILAAICDYLRVNTAFVAAFNNGAPELVTAVGSNAPNHELLREDDLRPLIFNGQADDRPQPWHGYWVSRLASRKRPTADGTPMAIGLLGIEARADGSEFSDDELTMLASFVRRAGQALEDMALQSEIHAALEGLLPQINLTRRSTGDIEYRPGRNSHPAVQSILEEDRSQFNEQVRAALRHYWGGPGLTQSRLQDLSVVRAVLAENDNNPSKALRAVLNAAIEQLRPIGEPKPLTPEWTLYSILELRFLKGMKVREAAARLALSEPDFYRKQRIAIDHLADVLYEMESDSLSSR